LELELGACSARRLAAGASRALRGGLGVLLCHSSSRPLGLPGVRRAGPLEASIASGPPLGQLVLFLLLFFLFLLLFLLLFALILSLLLLTAFLLLLVFALSFSAFIASISFSFFRIPFPLVFFLASRT
jgi:hypothetical protein